MKRTLISSVLSVLTWCPLAVFAEENAQWNAVETGTVKYRFPRFVDKNARKGFHGQHKQRGYCKIITNQGAVGWAESIPSAAAKFENQIVGHKVSELIAPGTGRAFCKWMNENGYADTRYADGERAADNEVLMELARTGDLDVYLPDIRSYGGITPWVNVMPKLAGMGVEASPHTWGSKLKTHDVAHLAAGVGNIDIVEGVTCLSDEIDYGDYPIKDGKIRVSDAPGFGMKLLK